MSAIRRHARASSEDERKADEGADVLTSRVPSWTMFFFRSGTLFSEGDKFFFFFSPPLVQKTNRLANALFSHLFFPPDALSPPPSSKLEGELCS